VISDMGRGEVETRSVGHRQSLLGWHGRL